MFQKGHLVGGPRPLGHIVLGQAVAKVNQQPTAYSDSATTAYQTPVDIDLDGSIDASSAEVTAHPVNGVVTINASNGVATYTPDDGFSGADSFEYRVADMERKWSEPVAVNLLVEPLQRFFTKLSSAAGSYMGLANTITMAGNFEIEFAGTFKSAGFYLTATRSDGSSRTLVFNDKFYLESGYNSADFADDTWLDDGKLHKFSYRRTDGTIFVYVDGTFLTLVATTRNVIIEALFSQFGSTTSVPYYDGYIESVKLWVGGTRDSVPLSHEWALNSDGVNGVELDFVGGNHLSRENLTSNTLSYSH